MGGNLSLLKWLVESEHCPIFTKSGADRSPLTTTSGMTVFSIAAKHGCIEMMRYLAKEKGCSVTEITDVDILQRGLHVALEVIRLFYSPIKVYINSTIMLSSYVATWTSPSVSAYEEKTKSKRRRDLAHCLWKSALPADQIQTAYESTSAVSSS